VCAVCGVRALLITHHRHVRMLVSVLAVHPLFVLTWISVGRIGVCMLLVIVGHKLVESHLLLYICY